MASLTLANVSANWLAVGSLLVAVVVGVLGPTITWKIAARQMHVQHKLLERRLDREAALQHKQIRASVTSKHRQQWINSLRDDISSLIANLTTMPSVTRQIHEAKQFLEAAQKDNNSEYVLAALANLNEAENKIFNMGNESVGLLSRIGLFLNLKEDKHRNLRIACGKLARISIQQNTIENDYSEEISAICEEVQALGSAIFKEEWEIIKRLE